MIKRLIAFSLPLLFVTAACAELPGTLTDREYRKFRELSNGLIGINAILAPGSTINTTGNITGGVFFGNGSGVSALNASNISTGTVPIARGGTGQTFSPINGTLLIGGVDGAYHNATLTAGGNVTIANANGTITISATDTTGGTVNDTAYGDGWNGVTDEPPSMNAVYDKMETISATGGGWTDGTNTAYVTVLADNVGIGLSDPLARLHVQGTAGMGFSLILADSAAAHKLAVTDAGDVGIGTTAPTQDLQVVGTGVFGGLQIGTNNVLTVASNLNASLINAGTVPAVSLGMSAGDVSGPWTSLQIATLAGAPINTVDTGTIPAASLGIVPDANIASTIARDSELVGANEAYDATNWDGDTSIPEKDDIRDKIETMPQTAGDRITLTGTDLDVDVGPVVNGDTANCTTPDAVYDWGVAQFQPLEATLTDIADGTIAENLVNTANPWGTNEIDSSVIISTEIDTVGEINALTTDVDVMAKETTECLYALNILGTIGARTLPGKMLSVKERRTAAQVNAYSYGSTNAGTNVAFALRVANTLGANIAVIASGTIANGGLKTTTFTSTTIPAGTVVVVDILKENGSMASWGLDLQGYRQ